MQAYTLAASLRVGFSMSGNEPNKNAGYSQLRNEKIGKIDFLFDTINLLDEFVTDYIYRCIYTRIKLPNSTMNC
jgi:hypothetical protein